MLINHCGAVLPALSKLLLIILISCYPFTLPKAQVKPPFVALLLAGVLGGGVLLLLLLVLAGSAHQLLLLRKDRIWQTEGEVEYSARVSKTRTPRQNSLNRTLT